mmetsp:Transcript_64589/g.58035  ORF Transcript_64589/g.58035 Transcript_64589/m.58035 type:complete len:193 (+) Transcript_64589:13-591(+)
MGGCCGAPHLELPTMKMHDSCDRRSVRKHSNVDKPQKLERITDCGDDDVEQSQDIASVHSLSSKRSIDLDLNAEVIIDFILNLSESELINGWNNIDKMHKHKLSLITDVDKLLTYYINCYIESKLPQFESGTEDHRYSVKSVVIVQEIKDLLQPILEHNGISRDTEYITFEWFNTNFKEYLRQIEMNESIRI